MSIHNTTLHITSLTHLQSIRTWIPLLVTTFLTLFLNVFSLKRKDQCDFVQTDFTHFRNEISEINLGDMILNSVQFGTLHYGVFRVHCYSSHRTVFVITGNRQISKQNIAFICSLLKAGTCNKRISACRILLGKAENKIWFASSRRRWENIINV